MATRGNLLAWIEPQGDGVFVGAYVGELAARRAPATQVCRSPDEARRWIEDQAAGLGLPVRWVDPKSE
jgi:hypothetical protein